MKQQGWVDRDLYPFRSRYMNVDGGRMHYVDEGAGPPVVLVHGTPTWSFQYRHLIADLSRDHRVVALDHIGFGLSDKPRDWSYRPEDHARNLLSFIIRLGLSDITLVVHDFGGPIGLSYAAEHPDHVKAIVLFNTWCWSLEGTSAQKVSRLVATPLGRFLYTRLNFSPRFLVRAAFGDRRKLSRRVHRQYIDAFPSASERQGPWVLARELVGSSSWYEELWQRRAKFADLPALVMWGMKDPAFGRDALDRWRETLRNARVVELPGVGHFVPEEAPDRVIEEVRMFLASLEEAPTSPSGAGREPADSRAKGANVAPTRQSRRRGRGGGSR